jgi:AraC-like DNA-binding protein
MQAVLAAIRDAEEVPKLANLAAISGLSYSRFLHRFKEEFQESPKAFLIRQRMGRAQVALAGTKQPISVIALESGFRTINLFTSQFKAATGFTPSAYRRQHST